MNLALSSRDARAERYRDIFLLTTGTAFFIFIVLRAHLLSFTTDENGTYEMFVSRGIIFPETYDLFSANNHLLNTALMIFCEKVFGSSELSLRLPNVLSGLLYIFSIAMMARRMKPVFISVAFFLVMNTNPFLVQYFSMARGYGLACGLTAFALWQAWRYFEDGYQLRHLVVAMLASSLAVFANFTYINLYLPAAGLLALAALWRPRAQRAVLRTRLTHVAVVVGVLATTLLIVVPIAMKMKVAGALFAGTRLFWDESIESVVDFSLYGIAASDALREPIVVVIQVLCILSAAIILSWSIWSLRKGTFRLFPLFILLVLNFSGIAVVLQYILMDTAMVAHRMAFFMLWTFLLVVMLAIERIPGHKIIRNTIAAAFAIPLVFHFVNTFTLNHGFGKTPTEDNNTVVALLEEHLSTLPPGTRLQLGLDNDLLASGFEYYKQTVPLAQYDITTTVPFNTHVMNDFVYVTPLIRPQVNADQWNLYREFPTGCAVYIRKGNEPVRKSTYKLVDESRDSLIVLNEQKTHFSFGGRWLDSVPGSSHFMARVEFNILQSENVHVVNDVMCFRNGEQIFIQRTDLRVFAGDEEGWKKVSFEVILPDTVQFGDDILSSCFLLSGDQVQFKNLQLNLDVY